jgi:hypothetical protein
LQAADMKQHLQALGAWWGRCWVFFPDLKIDLAKFRKQSCKVACFMPSKSLLYPYSGPVSPVVQSNRDTYGVIIHLIAFRQVSAIFKVSHSIIEKC